MLRNLLQSALRITIVAVVLLLLNSAARAATPNRAALVVQFGNGSVETRCVEFTETQITGYDLLARSGLTFDAAFSPGLGAAVCSIGGQGCRPENCFCEFPNYWSYWVNNGGGWTYSPSGSSAVIVREGALNGWVWSQGDVPPPNYTFAQVCAPVTAPTDTPAPPAPTPTVILIPTDAPVTPSPEPSATSTQPSTPSPEPSATNTQPSTPSPEPSATNTQPLPPHLPTPSPPHLLTSSPPHLLTSPPPHPLTSSPPHLPTSSPPHRPTPSPPHPLNQYLGFGVLLIGLALALIAAALRGQA